MPAKYLSVILPLALPWEPVYRSPDADIAIGDRVEVPVSGRSYIAVVSALLEEPGMEESKIKDARAMSPSLPPVSEKEIQFWRELASYYLCTVGEVYKAAYPQNRNQSDIGTSSRIRQLQKRMETLQQRLLVARKDNTRTRYREEIQALQAERESLLPPALPPRRQPCTQTEKPLLISHVSASDVPPLLLAAIRENLQAGRSVLYLIPEISHSDPIAARLGTEIPQTLSYHSQISEKKKRDLLHILRLGHPRLVVGTRSALFLPFQDLGLVIVSEEQALAYKQDSPAPRYHARDAAIILGRIHQARVLLTSLTPSLESVYNAEIGRYALQSQSGGALMAPVEMIDTEAEWKKHGMVGVFSRKLLAEMHRILQTENGRVLIVEPYLEEEAREHFPDAGDRLSFGIRESALGFDFEDIALIASLRTDRYFRQQDFRSDERAYQILAHFRAWCQGRGRQGRCILQSQFPEHPVLQQFVQGQDPTPSLLRERKAFGYPPYCRCIDVRLRDLHMARLERMASLLGEYLSRELPAARILGPFAKVEDSPERFVRLFLPRDKQLQQHKSRLIQLLHTYEKDRHYAGHLSWDVDPV